MYQLVTVQDKLRERHIKQAELINAQGENSGELDGFKITAEQCRAINAGEREAVDKFFMENERRLHLLAKCFLRRCGMPIYWDKKLNCWQPTIVEISDCINQLYVDMRRGFLVFALVPHILPRIICHSFRYAGVGGFGDEDGVYIHKDFKGAAQNVGA